MKIKWNNHETDCLIYIYNENKIEKQYFKIPIPIFLYSIENIIHYYLTYYSIVD